MINLMIKGRLGNQMFQYAFARLLQEKSGLPIGIDWSLVDARHQEENDGWEHSLDDFSVTYTEKRFQEESSYIQKRIIQVQEKIILNRYLSPKRTLQNFVRHFAVSNGVYLDDKYKFNYSGKCKDKCFLRGYFESPEYFSEIEDILRYEFTPKHLPLPKNKKLYSIINTRETICVTVRRGDFFSNEYKNIYGVCQENYYEKAIDYIRKKRPDAIVIAFSDDIDWVHQNLNFRCETFYEDGTDPLWEKMRMMYSCDHFVISNSTFSWWAQHLGRNPQKIVVAPIKWRNDGSDYIQKEERWILM